MLVLSFGLGCRVLVLRFWLGWGVLLLGSELYLGAVFLNCRLTGELPVSLTFWPDG